MWLFLGGRLHISHISTYEIVVILLALLKCLFWFRQRASYIRFQWTAQKTQNVYDINITLINSFYSMRKESRTIIWIEDI